MGGPRSPAWEDGPVAWTVTCFSGASGVPLQAWKAGQHGLWASAALCLFGGRGPAPLSLTAERVRAQAFPSVLTGTRLLCSDTPQRGSVPSVGRGRRERCTRGFPGLYPVGRSLADFHLRPRDRKPRLGGGACRALSILWVASGALGLRVGVGREGGLGGLPSCQLSVSEAVAGSFSGVLAHCRALLVMSAGLGSEFPLSGIVFCGCSVCAGVSCPHRVVLPLFLPHAQSFQWLRNHRVLTSCLAPTRAAA